MITIKPCWDPRLHFAAHTANTEVIIIAEFAAASFSYPFSSLNRADDVFSSANSLVNQTNTLLRTFLQATSSN